jgi:purine-binding chemotaxis protein CheW
MIVELCLFAEIGGTPVAIDAADIEAVMRLAEIMPVSRVSPHVRGLAAVRSRVLTVIDLQACISGRQMPLGARPLAIVALVGGHGYALLVDDVQDICAPGSSVQTVNGRIDPMWRPFAHGMIERAGRSHLFLHLADFMQVAPEPAAA